MLRALLLCFYCASPLTAKIISRHEALSSDVDEPHTALLAAEGGVKVDQAWTENEVDEASLRQLLVADLPAEFTLTKAEASEANVRPLSGTDSAQNDLPHPVLASTRVASAQRSSTRNKLFLVLIELFGLGFLGIDRFYMGGAAGYISGSVKLLTCGGCGVWGIIDYVAVMLNAISSSDSIDFMFMEGDFVSGSLETCRVLGIAGLVFIAVLIVVYLCFCCLKGALDASKEPLPA
mmetsp:Transcript_28911/g.76281  ORF Transcript_28911/g.76281 Transcript_28911/m.76281 type:complete len:235 (-) Transcript_28911:118-822(-)